MQQKEEGTFEYITTEHLRMSAIYWALTALDLMKSKNQLDAKKIISFVTKCQHPNGGFGGNIDHDPHLLYTLSAVQILALLGALDKIDKEKVANCIVDHGQP